MDRTHSDSDVHRSLILYINSRGVTTISVRRLIKLGDSAWGTPDEGSVVKPRYRPTRSGVEPQN